MVDRSPETRAGAEPASSQGQRLLDECALALGSAIDRLEEYSSLLATLSKYDAPEHAHSSGFEAWLEGQRGRIRRLITLLEDTAFDEFLRIADRNVRIRHYEDGDFV